MVQAAFGFTQLLKPLQSGGQIDEFEAAFNKMSIITFQYINRSFQSMDSLTTFSKMESNRTSLFNLVKRLKEAYHMALKDYTMRFPKEIKIVQEFEARTKNPTKCPGATYIESEYFKQVQEICAEHARRSRAPSQICLTLGKLISAKLAIDTLGTVHSKFYTEYARAWNEFQNELFDVIGRNFINLYRTHIVQCLEQFMNQQIQLLIKFKARQISAQADELSRVDPVIEI